MLVSHRKKFIYFKSYKTAGTSVESYLEKYCFPEGEWEELHDRDETVTDAGIVGFRGKDRPASARFFNHMPAAVVRERVPRNVWNSYLKIVNVRNPFDKAVSSFYMRYPDIADKPKGDRISAFRTFIADDATKKRLVDRHTYMINDDVVVDRFIRYEHLEEDLKSLCDELDLEFDPDKLPKFKAGLRRQDITLDEFYDKAAIAHISDWYDWEIERFGYQPPSLIPAH